MTKGASLPMGDLSKSTTAATKKARLWSLLRLFLASAVLLHVPFVVVGLTQEVRFQPAMFLTEYSKLLGSSVVSVLVALGWKRYDRAHHRNCAAQERAMALRRLEPAIGSLEVLRTFDAVHFDHEVGGALTERAQRQNEHRKLCATVQTLVCDIEARLQSLSIDVRQHLRPLDLSVSVLADALKRHGAAPEKSTARSIADAAGALHSLAQTRNPE